MTEEGILLTISRRGLSLACALIFGVPLLSFAAAAAAFNGLLGQTPASVASFAVLVGSLVCVGAWARANVASLGRWMRLESIDVAHRGTELDYLKWD